MGISKYPSLGGSGSSSDAGGVEESERVDMCESRVEVSDFAKSERGGVGTGDLVDGLESVEPF